MNTLQAINTATSAKIVDPLYSGLILQNYYFIISFSVNLSISNF